MQLGLYLLTAFQVSLKIRNGTSCAVDRIPKLPNASIASTTQPTTKPMCLGVVVKHQRPNPVTYWTSVRLGCYRVKSLLQRNTITSHIVLTAIALLAVILRAA